MKLIGILITSMILLGISLPASAQGNSIMDQDSINKVATLRELTQGPSQPKENDSKKASPPSPAKECWSQKDKKTIKVGNKESSGKICQSDGTFK